MSSTLNIKDNSLQKASNILRAVSHPLRLKILCFIHDAKKVNVNKIYASLKLEQSITSQHLRILKDADLVIHERNGKFIYYSLNYELLTKIAVAVKKFNEL